MQNSMEKLHYLSSHWQAVGDQTDPSSIPYPPVIPIGLADPKVFVAPIATGLLSYDLIEQMAVLISILIDRDDTG